MAICAVALVYDVKDTEGDDLPVDVAQAFRAKGEMTAERIQAFIKKLMKLGIDTKLIEYGEACRPHTKAGT